MYANMSFFPDNYDVFFHLSVSIRQFVILPVMDMPASLSRKQIQDLRLLRKRPERYDQGQFVVEGHRAVMQVLQNGILDVRFLVLSAAYLDALDRRNQDSSVDSLMGRDCPVYQVGSRVFQQLADTESAQGILAVCRLPLPTPADVLLDQTGVLLAADRIQDPGNLGTMVRTAAWFGLKGLVLSDGTTDLFHPKVVRSTAGATGVLPWLTTSLTEFLERASQKGWMVHLLDSGPGSVSHYSAGPAGRDILVAGNEATGLSEEIRYAGYQRLRVDPAGDPARGTSSETVESLNASVASAIVMAHFCHHPDK